MEIAFFGGTHLKGAYLKAAKNACCTCLHNYAQISSPPSYGYGVFGAKDSILRDRCSVGTASRLFLDHFSKHLSSVLGRTELCHKVWNPGFKKLQIIHNENHHLALLDLIFGLFFRRKSETTTTTTSQRSIAIRLQFVLQYASNVYCNTPPMCIAISLVPLRSEAREILSVLIPFVSQYASHLYCNTPPICIAVLLGNLGGCGHRDVPHFCRPFGRKNTETHKQAEKCAILHRRIQ